MGTPHPDLYGFSASYIARICHVDIATARRWLRGATCPPYTALVLLTGDLSGFGPQWRGWRMKSGHIVSPEGWAATPGDVMMVQLAQLQLGDYRRENRALKAALEDLDRELYLKEFEEQPLPQDWEIAAG